MKKGYRKCVCCEEPFDFESFGYIVELGDDEGKPICDGCYSDDSSDATPVTYYDGTDDTYGVTTSHVGTYAVHSEFDESELPELFEYARSITWHASDGWRGHYEGKAPKGWVNVIDDWFGIDGHRIEGDLELLRKKVDESGDRPDFPMIIAFPRTSNCCACGIEAYVKKEDKRKFERWLKS